MTIKVLLIALTIFVQTFPVYKAEQPTFDFGKIKENEVITHTFKIVNSGKIPLLIYSVSTTCGCTTTKYPKVIKPNKSDYIVVNFDSKGNKGIVNKFIVVMTNSKEEYHKLTIKGTVY